ncbi:MAG: hypothetical protein HYW57_07385 [Ignavibacteriales bacterium]|nr:hypothetical protein [Ignavibacteriales bacterium]
MKNFATIAAAGAFLFLVSTTSVAQVPRVLSYQGVLTDTTGAPKPDGDYTFVFRLYRSESGGSVLWAEAKTLPVIRGLFSTLLGDQTAFPDSVTFREAYWLGLEVGGQELSPRIRLGSVGYSLHAIRTDTATFALNALGIQRPVNPAITTAEITDAAITQAKLADNAVTSAKVANKSLQRVDVADDFKAPRADTADVALMAVLQDTSVGTSQLEDGAVTEAKLAPGSVTSEKIADQTIQRADVANDFKAPKADTADFALALGNNSVTTAEIVDGTITSADVAGDFRAPVADSAVVAGNVSSVANLVVASVSGDGGGLTNLHAANLAQGTVPSGRISGTYAGQVAYSDTLKQFRGVFTGDGSGLTGVSVSGTAGGDLSGTYPNPTIADTAVITSKIRDNHVTDVKIVSLSASKLTGALPALDGSALTNVDAATLEGSSLSDLSTMFAASSHDHQLDNLSGTLSIIKGGTGSTTRNFIYLNQDDTVGGTKIFAPTTNVTGLIARRYSDLPEFGPDIFAAQSQSGADLFRIDFLGIARGDGSGLTNLDASELVGTIPEGSIPAMYASAVTFSNSSNSFAGSFQGSVSAATFEMAVRTTSSDITADAEPLIFVDVSDGSRTVTLPLASASKGKIYQIKLAKKDSLSLNSLIIATSGSDLIEGLTSITLGSLFDFAVLVSDGNSWFILSRLIETPS